MRLLLPMLTIWGELVQNMEGTRTFTELYAYRFLPYEPLVTGTAGYSPTEIWEAGTSFQSPLQQDAAIAACELFTLFEDTYNCRVELRNGDKWSHHKILINEGFRHRVHVRVVSNG